MRFVWLVIAALVALTVGNGSPFQIGSVEGGEPASGKLFAASDTEEFHGLTPPDRLAVMEMDGAAVLSTSIVETTFDLNGLAPAGPGTLFSGDPRSSAHNELTFDGQLVSSTIGPLDPDCCNEDLAFDGTYVWRADWSEGPLFQYLPDGTPVASYSQTDVVGATFVGSTLWITKWSGRQVGTFDPASNTFTPKFSTPTNAGGLAYDSENDILWVGRQGGIVEGWDVATLTVIPGSAFKPFGDIPDTIDGLAFSGDAEPPDRKVLFIQGIGSESCPDDSQFVNRIRWLREELEQQVPGMGADDFLYYEYTSTHDGGADCSGTGSYTRQDSCWSLDDAFKQGIFDREVQDGGQGERLAALIRQHLADPDVELSIIAHSQGGVLAAYTIKEKLSQEYQKRVRAIVTLDSPLRGINRAGAGLLRTFAGCANDDRQFDSSFDMLPGGGVVGRINDGDVPETKLFTVDGDPGCQPLPANRCTAFALIDDFHSDAHWSTAHISVAAETHGDIWDGCFREGEFRTGPGCGGGALPREGMRLVRFAACAVAELSSDCAAFAGD